MKTLLCVCASAAVLLGADYDLLLKGGHVLDGKNKVNAVRDVAIKDGKIAAVAEKIDPATATRTVDASGLYVAPGSDRYSHACLYRYRRT